MSQLAAGSSIWYAVKGEVTLTSRLYFRGAGDINLILTDGCVLHASQGINLHSGQHLIVWGQSGQTGQLTAYHSQWASIGEDGYGPASSGDLTVNGGAIFAENYVTDGILCNDLTVNGGSVTAPGAPYAVGYRLGCAGIRCFGDAVINAGAVFAQGVRYCGAGLRAGGTITINGGAVTGTTNSEGMSEKIGLNAIGGVVINGGSVISSPAPRATPVNSKGENVYLLQIENPEGAAVSIDGVRWSPANHSAVDSADTDLYAYVPGTEGQQRVVTLTAGAGAERRIYQFDSEAGQYVLLSADSLSHYYDPAQGKVVEDQPVLQVPQWGSGVLEDTGATGGWYLAQGEIDASVITVQGNVNLILGDGCLFSCSSILVPPDSSLTIWGQNADYARDGVLTATAPSVRIYRAAIGGEGRTAGGASGTITINGGRITATGGENSAAIGGSQSGAAAVTINGGVVSATGGTGFRRGIGSQSGGSLTINGGTVSANGYASGSIVIRGGSVKGRMDGQPTDGNGNDVYLLTVDNPSGGPVTLAGRTWSPRNHAAQDGDTTLYAYVPRQALAVQTDAGTANYAFDEGTERFIPLESYDWDNAAWTWTGDGKSATLTVPCLTGGADLRQTVLASVTGQTTPSCEQAGAITYSASVTLYGRTYTTQRSDETAPATGHAWDAQGRTVRRTLSADGRTLTIYCLNDKDHVRNVQLNETEDTGAYRAPDCAAGTPGQRVYGRTFTLDGTVYTYDRLSVPIPAEHTWGPWEASDASGAVCEHTCQVCGAVETSSHWHQWRLPAQDDAENVTWTLGPDEYYVLVNVLCEQPDCPYHDTPMKVTIGADDFLAARDKSRAATCTEEGTLVYQVTLTLSGENGDVSQTYYSRPIPLPVLDHEWGSPAFTFRRAPGSPLDPQESQSPADWCSVILTCEMCGAKTPALPVQSITTEFTKAPTCTDSGEAALTATAYYEGKSYVSQPQTRTAAATGHRWGAVSAEWSEDFATAEVTFSCTNDPAHTRTVQVQTTSKVIAKPTCVKTGSVEYTADATEAAKELGYEGRSAVLTHTEITPALGHAWDPDGEVTVGVKGDKTTVTVYCKNNRAHSRTVYAELRLADSRAASCAEEGFEEYEMVYQVDGVDYTLMPMTYPIPKTPHTWSAWTENGDGLFVRTCQVCGEEEQSDHKHTYTFPDKALWDIAANGDAISAEVVLTCDNGEKETLTYSGDLIKSRVIKEATCTEPGQVEYSIQVQADGKSKTYTTKEELPATGHIWDTDGTVTWSADHSEATFTFECILCGETRTETVAVTATELVPADCETKGVVLYSAEAVLEGTYAEVQESLTIPATGHDWDAEGDEFPLEYGVQGDFTTVTVTCRSHESHTKTVYASLELVEEKCTAPTCDTAGRDVYKMTYTVDGETYTLGNEVEYTIPALGHLWGADHKCSRCSAEDGIPGEHSWHLPEPDETLRVHWSQTEPGVRPYLTVTAVCVDGNGAMLASQQIVVAGEDLTVTETRDCEKAGQTVYSATVQLGGESKTYTCTTVGRAPTGHWWGVSEEDVEWAADNSQVVFHFQCRWPWGKDHKADVTAAVEQSILKNATCTEEGQVLYLAIGELDGATVSVEKVLPVPALGHDYQNGVCTRCGAKQPASPTAKPGATNAPGTAPNTGDGTALLPWTALLLVCAASLTAVLTAALRRRTRRSGGKDR